MWLDEVQVSRVTAAAVDNDLEAWRHAIESLPADRSFDTPATFACANCEGFELLHGVGARR